MSLFDTRNLDTLPYYDGPLGFELTESGTYFRLWAPSATDVTLCLYSDGLFGPEYRRESLEKFQDGHWETFIAENLEGTYYDYLITTGGTEYRSMDPYAVGAGANGKRAMVLDLGKTDPEGWADDKAPERESEDVIYEIHVKDFTAQRFSGISEKARGKYMALTERGTHLPFDESQPTALEYLKSLGITHVQLMPIFDFASVDEMGSEEQFNWGYDPENYNVPEGSYSSDAEHGQVRVRELKEMVKALHESGIRVIMDVVYNHTYRLDSPLFRIEPWYFYRQNKDGSSSNGSGCGNDIATERPMVHRFILDSILYWTREYHMDGFRFDLMGLIDTRLMNDIREKLDSEYGKGEKLIYGEPWAAGGTAVKEGFQLSDKNALPLLSNGIGAFCDSTRDLIKGSNFDSHSSGFVNGGMVDLNLFRHAVAGWMNGDWHFRTKSANQTIQYVSSHDDWTLWDKLKFTCDEKEDFLVLDEKTIAANKAAAAMYFTMQGRPFMLSGEEAARTKIGVKNSYCSPLFINRFDWVRTKEADELISYYKGLIRLRKAMPAFYDKSERAKERITSFSTVGKKTVLITLDNSGREDYPHLLVIYSNEDKETSLPLEKEYSVLLDPECSNRMDSPIKVKGSLSLKAPAVYVLAY